VPLLLELVGQAYVVKYRKLRIALHGRGDLGTISREILKSRLEFIISLTFGQTFKGLSSLPIVIPSRHDISSHSGAATGPTPARNSTNILGDVFGRG